MVNRIIAGVCSILLGVLALFGAIIAIFLAAAAAEPGTATNRGETLTGSLVMAVLEGLLLAGVLVFAVYALSGRFLAWGWLVAAPLAVSMRAM